jgi:hypothetical protein
MEKDQKQLSRQKFISWTAGIGALLAIPAFLRSSKKKQETKTVKMLTQDGNLVMIDVADIPGRKKKISNNEIHSWVKGKTSKSN